MPTRPLKLLTERQARFVEAYLKTLHVQKAAVAAGYATKNAHAVGEELMQLPHVQAAIADEQARRAKRIEVSQDRVLKEIARLAFADIRNIFDEQGHLKNPSELDDDTAATIASIDIVERPATDAQGEPVLEYVHKVRMSEKTAALTLLCRHLGILNDKIDVTARLQKVYETAPDEDLIERLKVLLGEHAGGLVLDVPVADPESVQ
ncbi:MAG TPA: terminase small subunit [Gemmatimonadales bacterium]|nr:terminase small subunit [Gemmatimonadales bacterium]